MKKFIIICSIIGLTSFFTGCSSTNEVKEVRVIHEYHIYVHNVNRNMMRKTIHNQRQNQKFNHSKGSIDPRYDHKPGQERSNKKLGNPGRGIDPRYDHKTGAIPKNIENKNK